MINMHLRTKVMSLPVEERKELAQIIKASLTSDSVFLNRAEWMLQIIADIMGIPNIPIKGKEAKYKFARMMVAYQLRQEGLPLNRIGQLLGKNHSTILYNVDRWKEILENPKWYMDVIPVWEKFQDKLKEKEDEAV